MIEHDVIAKSGSWYSYDGNRIGQGKENVREFLKNNQSIAYEIEAKIRKILGIPNTKQDETETLISPKKEESSVSEL